MRVPVLSEKIYDTYPSSSFRLELYTVVGVFVPSELIVVNFLSLLIKIPYTNLTLSRVTKSEIGIKLLIKLFIIVFTKEVKANYQSGLEVRS